MTHNFDKDYQLNAGGVYDGKSLVNRLLLHCAKFENTREKAIKYAQKLLDLGHIEQINGSRIFHDGTEKYRWTDVASVLNSKVRNKNDEPKILPTQEKQGSKFDKPKRMVKISIETEDCEDTEIHAHIRTQPNKSDHVSGTISYETKQETSGQIFEGKSMKKMLSFTSETSKTEEIMRIVPITPGVTQILEDEPKEYKQNEAIESIGKREFQSRVLKFRSATHPAIVSFETSGTADRVENENNEVKADNSNDKIQPAQTLEKKEENKLDCHESDVTDRHGRDITDFHGPGVIDNVLQINGDVEPEQTQQPSTYKGEVTTTHHVINTVNEVKTLPFDLKSDIQNSPRKSREKLEREKMKIKTEDLSINVDQPATPTTKPTANGTAPTTVKPLFWKKIEFPQKPVKNYTVWNEVKRKIEFDEEEFSKLFSKPQMSPRTRKSRHEYTEGNVEGGILKVLSSERSRQVAIRSSTVHLAIEDIYDAIINLDDDLMDLDAIQALYDIRPQQTELDKIEAAIRRHPEAILDKPEQLLVMLAMISNLNERLESWLFLRQFEDRAAELEDHLIAVSEACRQSLKNSSLKHVLETILALGNFMNNGTNRGDAFGFQFDILPKIKDVKSKDGNINLLKYIVRKFIDEDENELKQDENLDEEFACPLPSQLILRKAASVSMNEVCQQMNQLSDEASQVEDKFFPKIINGKTCNSDVEMCTKRMTNQLRNIFNELDILNQFHETALKSIEEFKNYFVPKTSEDVEVVPFNVILENLEQFCNDFRTMWTIEMREKAKQKLLDIQKTSAERMSTLNIYNSPTPLKKRFLEKRQRDTAQRTVKTLPMYVKRESTLTDDSRQSTANSYRSSRSVFKEDEYEGCSDLHAMDSQVNLYVGKARKNSLEIEERIRCMKFNNTMKMKMARNQQRKLLKAKTC